MSNQTVLVVFTSLITSVISIAMLLLVFWQSPQQRTNQLFAIMTLLMAVFSLANLSARLTDELRLDIDTLFVVTSISYGWIVTALYFFSEDFTETENMPLRMAGIVLGVLFPVGILLGWVYKGPFPSDVDEGGFYITYKPFGLIVLLAGFAYLVVTLMRLRDNLDPRPQAIWSAVAVMLAGIALTAIRPLSNEVSEPWSYVLTFPYNALAMGIAALIMGRAVLQTQLFNPLQELNAELQKTVRELEIANQHKDKFLANMSHELRTPLNAIIGYTELLTMGVYGATTKQQQDRLHKVGQNSRRLLNLINDVLDLSKIVTGEMELVPRNVDVAKVVQEVMDSLTPLADEKGLNLFSKVEPGTAIQADYDHLQHVLTNLVGNAIKFTQQGSVMITAEKQTPYLRISIQDTGIGIPADMLPDIFKEFYQVGSGSTREYEGTGLGLAISRSIVELHGGRIEAESTPGQGSTFHVILPMESVFVPTPKG